MFSSAFERKEDSPMVLKPCDHLTSVRGHWLVTLKRAVSIACGRSPFCHWPRRQFPSKTTIGIQCLFFIFWRLCWRPKSAKINQGHCSKQHHFSISKHIPSLEGLDLQDATSNSEFPFPLQRLRACLRPYWLLRLAVSDPLQLRTAWITSLTRHGFDFLPRHLYLWQ